MNKKQNKCYKFQNKLGNVDNDMCMGNHVAFLKAFMSGSKIKYLKVMYYSMYCKCVECDKLISENKNNFEGDKNDN